MVLIMTLVLSATVGMAYAVRAAASKETQEVLCAPTPGEKAMEVQNLSAAMVDDLTRMLKKGDPQKREDIERIHRGVLALLVSTWTRGGYYWNSSVVPFFSVYDSTAKLAGVHPSNDYLRLLKRIVTEITPGCCSLILTQDGGATFSDKSFHAARTLNMLTTELDSHFQYKMTANTRKTEKGGY